MADCERYRDLISEYIDGTISGEDQAELFHHIESCSDCAQLLETYAEISRIMADDTEPPEELLSGVMAGVRDINDRRRQEGRIRFKRTAVRCLAAAACAAVILIPGLRIIFGGSGGSDGVDSAAYTTGDSSSAPEVKEYSNGSSTEESAQLEVGGNSAVENDDAAADSTDGSAPQANGFDANNSGSAEGGGAEDGLIASVQDVAQGYYAVVYADALPSEITYDSSRLSMSFQDGTQGLQITLSELTALEDAGSYVIVYENNESDSALLVYNP